MLIVSHHLHLPSICQIYISKSANNTVRHELPPTLQMRAWGLRGEGTVPKVTEQESRAEVSVQQVPPTPGSRLLTNQHKTIRAPLLRMPATLPPGGGLCCEIGRSARESTASWGIWKEPGSSGLIPSSTWLACGLRQISQSP